MSATKDNIFTPFATGGDVSHLFRTLSPEEQDTLFSTTNIPSLTKQFTSLPINVLPHKDETSSVLFGSFSNEIQSPSSPTSSILSLPEEVTQHTIPDDDLWQQASSQPSPSSKIDTWESFGASREEVFLHGNPFVTEQNPKVFDELLKRHMNHIYSPSESGTIVDEYLFREVCLLKYVSYRSVFSQFLWVASRRYSTGMITLANLNLSCLNCA